MPRINKCLERYSIFHNFGSKLGVPCRRVIYLVNSRPILNRKRDGARFIPSELKVVFAGFYLVLFALYPNRERERESARVYLTEFHRPRETKARKDGNERLSVRDHCYALYTWSGISWNWKCSPGGEEKMRGRMGERGERRK